MSKTNVFYSQTKTITNANLIRTMILVSLHIQVCKISSEMMSGSRIRVPIEIRSRLRSSEQGVHVAARIGGIRIIKPVIALQGHMTRFLANLTHMMVCLRTISMPMASRSFLIARGRPTARLKRTIAATTTAGVSMFYCKICSGKLKVNSWLLMFNPQFMS